MKLTGRLSTGGQLVGRITSAVGNLHGIVTPSPLHGHFIGSIIHSDTTPYYRGDYEVTPRAESQSLDTSGLRMMGDVIVSEIPYYETTNESGGYTVIIGG